MALVSQFNKEFTYEVLERFWCKFISEESSYTVITGNDIYNALGKMTDQDGKYTWSSPLPDTFSFLAQNGGYPQNYDREEYDMVSVEKKIQVLQKRFESGDYFHLPCNRSLTADRRIILNLSGNQTSFQLLERLYETEKDKIRKIKCFGKSAVNMPVDLKIDKLLIYLPKENVDTVLKKCLFVTPYKEIVPFCDLMCVTRGGKEESNFYYGLALELSGTSLMTRCAFLMIYFLTGTKYYDGDLNKIMVPLRKAIATYRNQCQKFEDDCFEFISSRL